MENYNEQRAAILRKVENRKQHKKGSKKQGENLEVSIESEFDVYNKLRNEQAQIALIGLGYVGLPIALEFARDWPVLGYDINEERVQMMKEGRDPSNEISSSDFFERKIEFSAKESDLRKCHFFIVAVPTPIDENRNPNLGPLKSASATVGKYLKKGDYVIFESTVFPGCTEEECIPILEEVSGLKLNSDFKVGYSPERINPGDKKNTLVSIKKVVSGSDDYSLEQIAKVYGTVIKAGVHKASSLKVAEAAKIVENSQRDINIAFMNELSQIFNKLNINTSEVLEAAGTKWNFLKFYPGLVGGHCIGVDPYYLIEKSKKEGYTPALLSYGRAINDSMPLKIGDQIAIAIQKKGIPWTQARVLVRGITFKEDVSDIRNSKTAELIKKLKLFGIKVDVIDPHADKLEVKEEYDIEINQLKSNKYDVIVQAVSHKELIDSLDDVIPMLGTDDVIFYDIKGIASARLRARVNYMSL